MPAAATTRALPLALLGVVAGGAAAAEPGQLLRMASVAPDGTVWARELRAFARDVDSGTHGAVRVKWYFGGIAGDEVQMGDRIRRDQLDGAASGGMLCQRLAPSMRVTQVLGLFQSRDESAYVIGRLQPVLDEEFRKQGFANLGEAGVGPIVLYTRHPVRNLAELRRERLWVWDLDEAWRLQFPAIQFNVVPLPLSEASHAFDHDLVDGFIAPPSAALAFQWNIQAHYFVDLRVGFLTGCLLVSNRTFDQLPLDAQRTIRAAAAKLESRFENLGRAQDEALLGGLMARQGLSSVALDEGSRSEFFETAHAARERLGDQLVPSALLNRVNQLLADYRTEHPNRPSPRR